MKTTDMIKPKAFKVKVGVIPAWKNYSIFKNDDYIIY